MAPEITTTPQTAQEERLLCRFSILPVLAAASHHALVARTIGGCVTQARAAHARSRRDGARPGQRANRPGPRANRLTTHVRRCSDHVSRGARFPRDTHRASRASHHVKRALHHVAQVSSHVSRNARAHVTRGARVSPAFCPRFARGSPGNLIARRPVLHLSSPEEIGAIPSREGEPCPAFNAGLAFAGGVSCRVCDGSTCASVAVSPACVGGFSAYAKRACVV